MKKIINLLLYILKLTITILSEIEPLILYFWDFSWMGGNPNPKEQSKIPLSIFPVGESINFKTYLFLLFLFSILGLIFINDIPFGETNAKRIIFFCFF